MFACSSPRLCAPFTRHAARAPLTERTRHRSAAPTPHSTFSTSHCIPRDIAPDRVSEVISAFLLAFGNQMRLRPIFGKLLRFAY